MCQDASRAKGKGKGNKGGKGGGKCKAKGKPKASPKAKVRANLKDPPEAKEKQRAKVRARWTVVGTAAVPIVRWIAQEEPPRTSKKFELCPFSYREHLVWQARAALGRSPPVG